MQTVFKSILVFIAACLPLQAAYADKYSEAMKVFQNAGESGAYFQTAHGYALFPTIGKGGIGIGGAHGKGKVYRQGTPIGNTSMSQVTVGFQLGGQAYSQIIFFENEAALEQFTSGNFEFGAQATAVAITAGASAEANTGGGASAGASGGKNDASTVSGGYRKGMAVFTVAKGGLMYEASIGGQKFSYEPY
jgi:lipid-binding SYLF domain-containing protein